MSNIAFGMMTFDSRQRPDIFDARQSSVKGNIKSAPTPFLTCQR